MSDTHPQSSAGADATDDVLGPDADRALADSVRNWRGHTLASSPTPDARLDAMFASEPAERRPARWRQWMQRPAVAFAASFALVLLAGAGAFALVARNSDSAAVAAPTSSLAAQAARTDTPGEITLPADLSEQTGYATCVFGELTTWFAAGLDSTATPQLIAECGFPPIPDLGPDAALFRDDLQVWADCVATEVQAALPDLAMSFTSRGGDLVDPTSVCDEPPDPRDYGLELPFADFDWENFDPSMLFGDFGINFGDFDFEFGDFDLDELLKNLPDGVNSDGLPFGDFDWETFDLDEFLNDLPEGFELIFPGGDFVFPNDDFVFPNGDFDGLDFGNFDLEDLENFDLDGLLRRLESQLGDLELEGFDFESFDFENFDFQGLLDQLESGDLDNWLEDLLGGRTDTTRSG